jgi:hypothetical protein
MEGGHQSLAVFTAWPSHDPDAGDLGLALEAECHAGVGFCLGRGFYTIKTLMLHSQGMYLGQDVMDSLLVVLGDLLDGQSVPAPSGLKLQ